MRILRTMSPEYAELLEVQHTRFKKNVVVDLSGYNAYDILIAESFIMDGVDKFLLTLEPRVQEIIKLLYGLEYERRALSDLPYSSNAGFDISRMQIDHLKRRGVYQVLSLIKAEAEQSATLTQSIKEIVFRKLAPRLALQEFKPKKNKIKPPPKPVTEVSISIRNAVFASPYFSYEVKMLLSQLYGWAGYQQTPFADIAAARSATETDLANQLNNIMRELHRLRIWRNPPQFP